MGIFHSRFPPSTATLTVTLMKSSFEDQDPLWSSRKLDLGRIGMNEREGIVKHAPCLMHSKELDYVVVVVV